MEALLGGSSPKQVYTGAPEFAGAGSGEDKLNAPLFFNERMDHLEEMRQLLNLVDQDGFETWAALDAFAQAFGFR